MLPRWCQTSSLGGCLSAPSLGRKKDAQEPLLPTVIFISKLLQIRVKREWISPLYVGCWLKKQYNLGNDLVVVESENLVWLGEKWGCSWGWDERKVEEPEKPLCCCEGCLPSVSAEKKRKAVSWAARLVFLFYSKNIGLKFISLE